MGVAISHKLGQKKLEVKKTLDRTQKVAEQMKDSGKMVGLEVEIRRPDDFTLLVDINGCETLGFEFKSVKEIEAQGEEGWDYEYNTLTKDGTRELEVGYEIQMFPQNEMFYASSFCKTQYGDKIICHKWVADLIRTVAQYCPYAEVSDEGDYYHTGILEDAGKAIYENGQIIESLGEQLQKIGYKKN